MKRTAAIAGGSVAGLLTGLALAQKGWRVRVHERSGGLSTIGEGIYVWENGLRVLEALGVLAPVIADGIRVVRHERRDHHGKTISSSRLSEDVRLYVVLRERLSTVLCDALIQTGGEIVFNSRAVGAALGGCLHLADGSALSADLVVVAEGADSPIRDKLGLLKWRRRTNQFGYTAVIPAEPGELMAVESACYEYWNGSHCLIYAPCSARSAFVQLISVGGDKSLTTPAVDLDCWRSLFPKLAAVIARIPREASGDWFELLRLQSWSKGKVAVIGSAASAQPPVLGHQVGCTMMSAFSLAQCIDRAGVIEGLAMWEARERGFDEWAQWVAYLYGQLAFVPAGARIAALKAIDASEWVRRRTVLAAACRDVTRIPRPSPVDISAARIYPLIH
jgi:2-polyprenyl-6-methoxyphenol hydroxylase-like FAD-dependent oxidoreductase